MNDGNDIIAILIGLEKEEYNRWCLAASIEGDKSLTEFIKRVVRDYMEKE